MLEKNNSFQTKKSSIRDLNYNVRMVLLFTLAQSLGTGIWMGNILSAFIYLIADSSNELLGVTSAATGFTMTLVVLPAGILADKFRRDRMLKIATIFGIVSAILLFLANDLLQIFISLISLGFFVGIVNPAMESLFADSVASGNRSRIYSIRHLIGQVGNAVGPFLNIILFLIFGDEWKISILKSVIGVGLVITLLSYTFLFLFNDQKSLGLQSDSILEKEEVNSELTFAIESKSPQPLPKAKILSKKWIPYILVGCNVIIGLGAGMTIKFFPIFFKEEYQMKPTLVELISGITAIVTGLSGLIAQHFSRARGRPQMIFVVQGIATLCLLIIALYPPTFILIIVFIMRGALMNASQPLSRSILMDVVPKEKRGKWNSLESVAWGLFWNFSAIIGGYLIGPTNNFRLNFIVTACIYICGTLPMILLFKIVSRETVE